MSGGVAPSPGHGEQRINPRAAFLARRALMLGAGLAIVIALTGVAADDPYDGILRGLLESGAFLGGYAVLGRCLGIRR
jgi:hypothetical protein